MIDDTLFFMLVVGLVISAGMLFLFIWAAKSGQFDDASKRYFRATF
jgi:cbb3-type cytochrome oxidase maturation protein